MTEVDTIAAPRFGIAASEALAEARRFAGVMAKRRTVRDFSPEPVDASIITACVEAAATAPSGANVQPWRFAVITDAGIKRRIRVAAEAEEREFYSRRASQEWLDALAPLGTDHSKPFLETAPVLIAVFEVHKGPTEPRPYYVKESVGIAVGFLLAALHQAGLATLTHTPSPMRFLGELCGRPRNERPFVLIPVGHPAPGARVPAITRKPVSEVMVRL